MGLIQFSTGSFVQNKLTPGATAKALDKAEIIPKGVHWHSS